MDGSGVKKLCFFLFVGSNGRQKKGKWKKARSSFSRVVNFTFSFFWPPRGRKKSGDRNVARRSVPFRAVPVPCSALYFAARARIVFVGFINVKTEP